MFRFPWPRAKYKDQTLQWYDNYDERDWAKWQEIVEGWEWSRYNSDNKAVKSGPCPRCSHPIRIEAKLTVFGYFRPSINEKRKIHVKCKCQVKHGEESEGCGFNCYITSP